MLENQGPKGISYEHDGKSYDFEPKLLSALGQKLVKRRLQQRHEQICQSLVRLAGMSGIAKGVQDSLLDRMYSGFKPGLAEIVTACGDVECMPVILTVVCPQLPTVEAAEKFINSHDNVITLSGVLVRACGLEEIKNLHRLIRDQFEDETDQAKQNGQNQSQSTDTSPASMDGATSM